MSLEQDDRLRGVVEDTLDGFANLEGDGGIGSGPNAQNVLRVADAENGTANIVTDIPELITNDRQNKILPVSSAHTLLEANDPLAALAILVILPDGSDALFEKVVVGNVREASRLTEVRIDHPKLLDGGESSDLLGRLLVVLEFGAGSSIPDDPGVAQG